MKKIAAALCFVSVLWAAVSIFPTVAQNPQFPQTLPANTVVGRTGIGSGPAQAIPISSLFQVVGNGITGFKWGPSAPGIPTFGTGELYYDQTNTFSEHNAPLNISTDLGGFAPPAVIPTQFTFAQCQGNNSTLIGCSGLFIQTQDRSSVNASNKGILYGANIGVAPSVARNNSPFDDATGLVIQNNGTGKATDAIYVGIGTNVVGSQWVSGVLVAPPVDSAFRFSNSALYGIDFVSGSPAVFANQAFRAPNNAWSGARNAANSADINAWKIDGSNLLQLANSTVTANPANGNLAVAGTLASGANGGTGGSLTLNGATSGSSSVSVSATGSPQYSGTATNDNAPAGDVGEFVSSTVSSPGSGITSNTPANVTSISLTAGDWDVNGACYTAPASTTVVNSLGCSLSTTSATMNTTPLQYYQGTGFGAVNAVTPYSVFVGAARFSLSATTTVYLVVDNTFTTSTETAYGAIAARRRR